MMTWLPTVKPRFPAKATRLGLLSLALYGLILGSPQTLRAMLFEPICEYEAKEESRQKTASEGEESASPSPRETRVPNRLGRRAFRLSGTFRCENQAYPAIFRAAGPFQPDLESRNGCGAPLLC